MNRIIALIKKEILAILNDRKSLFVVIVPPLMQLLIFAFSATTEVKNLNLAVMDKEGSYYSKELIQKIKGSTYVNKLYDVQSYKSGEELINTKEVIAFLVIPDNFSKNLGFDNSKVQMILDGRRANTAQISEAYINQILLNFTSGLYQDESGIEIYSRNLYNPNLNNFWWIVPNLFGSITMLVAIILSALSIARERELGTFEQILVSPLKNYEILLGKFLPGLIISLLESTIILFIAIYLFKVPFVGSIWLLYLGAVVFLLSISGAGLFISALCNTQQQAILGAFVFLLPSFLLSGFATPVENMPSWLQPATDIIPLKHYILLIRGVFLKDITFDMAVPLLVPMAIFGIVSMALATILFKKRTI
ncbi:MAG: ABC transporter permease [Campylobacteraceae bacterium]